MNSSSIAILAIITVSALVFGGIVFFGLPGRPPSAPPVVSGTLSRIPDILNLPGFGNQNRQAPGQAGSGGTIFGQTNSPDIVVEKNELPSPAIPSAPAPSQLPKPGIRAPESIKISTPASMLPRPQTPAPQPQPIPQPVPASPTVSSGQPAAASFSVFKASPQLGALRTQMVQEGVIGSNEFTRIKNNADMEAFMFKLVEWQARKASSTEEQVQDALDRIRKAYNQIRR